MSNGRASIFDSETSADFDVSGFEPRPRQARPKPDKSEIRAAAEQRGFTSREPEQGRAATPPEPSRSPAPAPKPTPVADAEPRAAVRRRRQPITGRSKQLNLKITQDTLNQFYEISNAQGWVLGETLEHALAALQRELDDK